MNDVTFVYCGSLASVHSHKPASPSRVSASCPLRRCTCSFSGSSLQAQPCERVAYSLSALAGAMTSLSIGVVGNSLIGLMNRFALQPARVPSGPVPVIPTRENAPRPEPRVCGCEPCICGEPRASATRTPHFHWRFQWEMQKKLESSGWRRGGQRNWLMPGTWSLTADMSQRGPISTHAVGNSTGRPDAVSSPGSHQAVFEDLTHVWCLVSRGNE